MNEDEIERELRMAAELLDPVPARLMGAAVAGFTWRTIDADLAELVFDSLDQPAESSVRGSEHPRLLTFQAGELIIELELATDGTSRRLIGRVTPPAPVQMEIRHGRGTITLTADALGRFAAGDVPSGRMRLRCPPTDDAPEVVTDWFIG